MNDKWIWESHDDLSEDFSRSSKGKQGPKVLDGQIVSDLNEILVKTESCSFFG